MRVEKRDYMRVMRSESFHESWGARVYSRVDAS